MRSALAALATTLTIACGDDYPASVRVAGDSDSVQQQAATTALDAAGEFRRACALELDLLGVDRDLGATRGPLEVDVENRASGLEACSDFAWVGGLVSVAALLEPQWAGPNIASAPWDCNHSTLEYGVYRNARGQWQYLGGGLAYGELATDGTCQHSVDNFPTHSGSDEMLALAVDDPTEVRVALRAWSHNDTAMGHPGDECASPSCYWPTRLRWSAY